MRVSRVVAFALGVATAGGCGPLVPHPTYGAQAPAALEQVDRPPPPARVEVVPAQPAPDAVWVDGEWIWRRSRWAWLLGRWVVPPAGAVFAPWTFVRGKDGKLWYARGGWRDGSGERVSPPPALALASVQGGAVVDAEGEVETTGPILHEQR
jgi:hypothetical protein